MDNPENDTDNNNPLRSLTHGIVGVIRWWNEHQAESIRMQKAHYPFDVEQPVNRGVNADCGNWESPLVKNNGGKP